MPRRTEIRDQFGRRYALVPSQQVLRLDQAEAETLVRRALEASGGEEGLAELAVREGWEPRDMEAILKALAADLASGRLMAIVEDEPLAGLVSPAGTDDEVVDWDNIPSLGDLDDAKRRPSPATLEVEVLDYTGIAFGGLELELEMSVGGRERVRLDALGRWSTRAAAGAGPATLVLPERIELSDEDRRRTPLDGFHADGADAHASRVTSTRVELEPGRRYRIIVDPPPRQASTSFPADLFSDASAFPLPGISHLVKYAQELTDRDPAARIGLFAHTEAKGDIAGSKLLAERRAHVAHALLIGDYGPLADVARAEDWPLAAYQTMLRVLGCNPTAIDGEPGMETDRAVRSFRRGYDRDVWHDEGRARAFRDLGDGDALDDATKAAIVDAYHAELSGRIEPHRLHGPGHMGCGELNALGGAPAEDRRVTLTIYGPDAPPGEAFPCKRGDASACQVDAAGTFSCRFYRERIRETRVDDASAPFWDFEWLRTRTGKAHLSALTHLADSNDVEFVVSVVEGGKQPLEDAGAGALPPHGVEIARLPGLIRSGIAYALWDTEHEYDPFDVEEWFRMPGQARELWAAPFRPPVFSITAAGRWGYGNAPGYRAPFIELVGGRPERMLVLCNDGTMLLADTPEALSELRRDNKLVGVYARKHRSDLKP